MKCKFLFECLLIALWVPVLKSQDTSVTESVDVTDFEHTNSIYSASTTDLEKTISTDLADVTETEETSEETNATDSTTSETFETFDFENLTSVSTTEKVIEEPSKRTQSKAPSDAVSNNVFIINKSLESYDMFDPSPGTIPDASSTTESNSEKQLFDVIEMTSHYHEMRVKLANYSHIIENQKRIITKLSESIRNLEADVSKFKSTHDDDLNNFKLKNEECRIDFNKVKMDLKVARKLIAMEKYSVGVKKKLERFVTDENLNL